MKCSSEIEIKSNQDAPIASHFDHFTYVDYKIQRVLNEYAILRQLPLIVIHDTVV